MLRASLKERAEAILPQRVVEQTPRQRILTLLTHSLAILQQIHQKFHNCGLAARKISAFASAYVVTRVEAILDIGPTNWEEPLDIRRASREHSALVSLEDVVRSLFDSKDGTRDPDTGLVNETLHIARPLPPLFMAFPPAVPLADTGLGVGDAPEESLFAFCSLTLTWDSRLS